MANTLITPDIIAEEALMMLENNMVMGANVHRRYEKEFVKVGTAIRVRKPLKFTATKARTRTTSTHVESTLTFTVATQAHVSWAFTSAELTMTIEEYSERYIKPAASELANTVDADLTALYIKVAQTVGTPGSTPSTFMVLGDAATKLDNSDCPADERVLVVNPSARWNLANGLSGYFDQQLTRDVLRKGFMGNIAQADILMDQNIKAHTRGTLAGTTQAHVDGASQSGTSINTEGWTEDSDVLEEGDVLTFAGCYNVNLQSGAALSDLKQFVVKADVQANSATDAASPVTIDPAMITTGPYKTCSGSPADGAAIVMVGTGGVSHTENLMFHKNAFGLVVVPMEMPAAVWGARKTHNGLSIRIVKYYDGDSDEERLRMDIMYGVVALYPELAVRVVGE